MKKSDPSTPPEQLTAYERWELPVLGEESARRSRAPKATKPPTAAELEGIREAAYQEGLEQGKQDGHEKGFQEGRVQGLKAGKDEGLRIGTAQGETAALKAKTADIQTRLTQLSQLMTALQQPVQEYQEEVEEAMLNLVLAISRAVIFRDLSLGPGQIKQVVKESLAALPNTDEMITVFVNPTEYEFLSEHLPAGHHYRYSSDERVMIGGCRVETRHTLLNYTVEKRFQAAVQQMLSRHSDQVVTTESHDFTDQMGEMSDFHRELLETSDAAETLPPETPARTNQLEGQVTSSVPEAETEALTYSKPSRSESGSSEMVQPKRSNTAERSSTPSTNSSSENDPDEPG